MAKKRLHDSNETNLTETASSQNGEPQQHLESTPSTPSTMSADTKDPLMDEVQTFLNLRDELARKLATEIEATEEKLAELKKTAASLFPASEADSNGDRKAKKPKPKPVTPKEKTESMASPVEAIATAD